MKEHKKLTFDSIKVTFYYDVGFSNLFFFSMYKNLHLRLALLSHFDIILLVQIVYVP